MLRANTQNSFVNDGHARAYAAARCEVLQRYEEQLQEASSWRRFMLWREIEREAKDHLKKVAPKEALY